MPPTRTKHFKGRAPNLMPRFGTLSARRLGESSSGLNVR